MTIQTMARAALALFIALSVGACASADAPSEPSADTTQALSTLAARVTDLEVDLATASDQGEQLSARLDSLGDKLDRSLERLREALAEARSGSTQAADAAASALATAQSVASDLSVLEERYEYHLRRYHGGGG